MKQVKASGKFSPKDTQALNVAIRLLTNIKEVRVAEKIAAMAKNGYTTLSLYNNIRGRREILYSNWIMVESILQDCYFSYIGNDKFKFATESSRRKPMTVIVKALKDARIELNISQSMLARSLNVQKPYISAIENGRQRMSVMQAARFASALGMELCISLKRKDNSPLLEGKLGKD
jgi:DNA-binding XRE family transcriptional regulator